MNLHRTRKIRSVWPTLWARIGVFKASWTSQPTGSFFIHFPYGAIVSPTSKQLPVTSHWARNHAIMSSGTCQAVDDATAVNGAVGGARLVENLLVRQRLLQYCRTVTQTARKCKRCLSAVSTELIRVELRLLASPL